MNEQKPRFKWSYLIVLIFIVLLAVLLFSNNGYKGKYIDGDVTEIQELIDGTHTNAKGESEQLAKIYYKGNTIYFLVEGSRYENAFPRFSDYYIHYENGDGLLAEVKERINTYNETATEKITVKVGVDGFNWLDLIIPVLYLGFGIFLVVMIFRIIGSSNKGAMSFGKSKAKAYTSSKVRFSDIAGTEEEKEELKEIVEFLKSPKKFTDLGARIPKGVLLVGYPGTGKTLLARAVAGEANVPFISISGSDFVEMFVGVGASRVRDLFEQAKKNKPCIVFIDEIDAVGRQRGAGLGGGNDEREQTLNQLLVEMDGFSDNSGIIVIAATNRPDVLDPALLRPGRFDRTITVSLPDKNGREAILKVHARNKRMGADVNFENIASRTPGFSGAELENVLNEAAILAVRQNKEFIEMKDIDEAIDRVIGGPAKKGKIMTEEEKRLVAYHESGHAIVGLKLASAMKVQKITIIPRGDAGGYVMMTPTDDRFLVTKGELEERIAGLLAGRVSEEIFFKDVTSGASDDIEKATKIARMMVTNLGMSSLGPIQYEQPQGNVFLGRDYTNATRNISSEIAFQIDQEISKIMTEAIEKARKVILDNKEDLTLIAETLLVEETITYEQVVYLLEHRVLPPKENKIPEVEVNPSEEKKEENAE